MTQSPQQQQLWISELTLDEALQPRCQMDRELLKHYAQLLNDGVNLPPVIVFDDGRSRWLADGFHRVEAHRQVGRDRIVAWVFCGGRLDALRYSLSANATHGKPRSRGDLRRAYTIAKQHGLVTPGDATAVQALLNCSSAWAFKLTAADRHQAKADRRQQILALHAGGSSLRSIAQALGISRNTVAGNLKPARCRLTASTPDESADAALALSRPEWMQREEELLARIQRLQQQRDTLLTIREAIDPVWRQNPVLSLEAVYRQLLKIAADPSDPPFGEIIPGWLKEEFQ